MTVKNLQYLSQLDPGGVIKNVHDELGNSLRVADVNSQVPPGYTKVILEKDLVTGSVTKASFYAGVSPERTRVKFFGDISGSLNSTYFYLYNADDNPEFYVWYNVDNTGIDPDIAGKTGFEIPISENDPASIVTLATSRILEYSTYFNIETNGSDVLLITNKIYGMTSNSVDVTTGFGITTSLQGVTALIKSVELPLESGFIYVFNYGSGRFEILPESNQSNPIVISTPTIQNISIVLANTEYIVTIPAGTRKFELKVRDSVQMKLAYVVGQSGTNYITIKPGVRYYQEDLMLSSSLVIYVQLLKPNQTLEVLAWS